MSDLNFQDHGTVFLLEAGSDEGRDWLEENVEEPDWNPAWLVDRVIETNYVSPIITGALMAGLTVTIDKLEVELV